MKICRHHYRTLALALGLAVGLTGCMGGSLLPPTRGSMVEIVAPQAADCIDALNAHGAAIGHRIDLISIQPRPGMSVFGFGRKNAVTCMGAVR